MGKVNDIHNSQDHPQQTIQHFTHPHPLHLQHHHPQQTLNVATCCGCKLKASGLMYSCTLCGYFLHVSCSQLPQHITHPFDRHNHVLSLLPSPVYTEGVFSCDACGIQGSGFSYHCGPCGIDLHTLCSTKPMVVALHSHHHALNLTFSPPYDNKSFSCDVCHMLGSDHWLYRCNYCEFDVHLGCTTAKPPPPPPVPTPRPAVQQAPRVQQHQARPRQNQVAQNQQAPTMMNGLMSQVIQGVVQDVLAGGGAAPDPDTAADDSGNGFVDYGGDDNFGDGDWSSTD